MASGYSVPLRAPPPPPILPSIPSSSSFGDAKSKFKAADAVLANPTLSGPLKEIVDAVSPLRTPVTKTETKRRTPPMPAVLGPPSALARSMAEAPAKPSDMVDSAIMSKALEAVRKPRLSSALRGSTFHPLVVSVGPTKQANKQKSALVKELAKETEATSSAEAMASFQAATTGMTAAQRKAYILKRRADEARVQQLRGIFAAYDGDRDGQITKNELMTCLLALGIEPSPSILSTFEKNDAGLMDTTEFVKTIMTKIEEPASSERMMDSLFVEFDKDLAGRFSLASLLHILCEVDTNSALQVDEVNELLSMTGIMNELQSRDASAIYSTEVDYKALIKHMAFPMPKKSSAAAKAEAALTSVSS